MTDMFTVYCPEANFTVGPMPLPAVAKHLGQSDRDCPAEHPIELVEEPLAEDELAELKAKLEEMRVIVAASLLKWEIDEEFDRQYELEQLQAKLWEVVK